MKPILNIFYIFFCIYFSNSCHAQGIPSVQDTTFETRVVKSDLIIEGKVLSTECFMSENVIYTSARIKITKLFKGTLTDSLVEFVFMGGYYNGGASIPSHCINLGTKDEGVFLFNENTLANGTKHRVKTDQAIIHSNMYDSVATLAKDLKSYVALSGNRDCILYHARIVLPGNHLVTGGDIYYDDLETDLFQRIESATGQKRRVLGPNMFEIASRKQKK